MEPGELLLMAGGGILSGVLAGILGIGGGVLLVPLVVAFGYEPVKAAATSSLAILITASSGTIQNLRMGEVSLNKVIRLGIPAILTAILGAFLADKIPSFILLTVFGIMLVFNTYLVGLRKSVVAKAQAQTADPGSDSKDSSQLLARVATGGSAGFLAGLLGVGGGVIMVPMQILLLNEPIKAAIRTSLGVIVITALSSCIEHARNGNILFIQGIALGTGGFIGAQFGSRFLPRLSDQTVSILFRALMGILAVYTFWRAWADFTQV